MKITKLHENKRKVGNYIISVYRYDESLDYDIAILYEYSDIIISKECLIKRVKKFGGEYGDVRAITSIDNNCMDCGPAIVSI